MSRQYVIKLKSGSNYVASVPDDWEFSGFIRSILATGYWADPNIYIAKEEIAFMMPLGIQGAFKNEDELAAMQSQGQA